MQKHNADPLAAAGALVVAHEATPSQAQSAGSLTVGEESGGGVGAQGRVDGTDGRPGGAGASGANDGATRGNAEAGGGQSQSQAQGGHTNPGNFQQVEGVAYAFDLHQYKTVAAGDLQYKPVSLASLAAHKDLCLAVASSTLQVDHLNS